MHNSESAVWLELYRYLTSLMGWLIVFKMIDWLRDFYKGLYKRREELGPDFRDSPLKWWFVLFCGMSLLILAVAMGSLYSAYRNFPFNPISFMILPGEITIFVGLLKTNDFVKAQVR